MLRGPRSAPLSAGVVLLAAVLSAQSAQTPEDAQVFRAGTETVAIYATVLDRYGEMILNLDRDDFEVTDDGKPQALTVFVKGLQPITATLMIDTSASMTLNLDLAKAAAEQFVIRMLPGDKVRTGTFSDRVDLDPEFTSDRDELLKRLRADLHFGNPTKLWDAVNETMSSLTALGGRRVIMLLTDGIDTASTTRDQDVLARARSEELMVYVVQFRSTARASLAEIPLSPSAGDIFSDSRRFSPVPSETLRALASQTGGGQFILGQYDDVNTTFTHVMHELHYQYVLGFTPQKQDGRVHELRVRVKKPNTAVRARQSYKAAPGSAESR